VRRLSTFRAGKALTAPATALAAATALFAVPVLVKADVRTPIATSAARTFAAAPSRSDASIEAECRQFSLPHFRGALCSEALGRWLPRLDDRGVEPIVSVPTRVLDSFRNTPGATEASFAAYTPPGTRFVHGDAGPPRGTVVYDPVHRIAMYGEGCCSYYRVVLAAGVPPPPVRVATRDLRAVRTDLGIGLGASFAAVERIYGTASLQRLPAHPGLGFVVYENEAPRKPPGPCVQDATFGLRNDRVTFIELYNGC